MKNWYVIFYRVAVYFLMLFRRVYMANLEIFTKDYIKIVHIKVISRT
jgi:hypothetical protein